MHKNATKKNPMSKPRNITLSICASLATSGLIAWYHCL